MRVCLVLAVMALASLSFSASDAMAAGKGGESCSSLGVTAVTDDGTGFLVCLRKTAADTSLAWKPVTGGGGCLKYAGQCPAGYLAVEETCTGEYAVTKTGEGNVPTMMECSAVTYVCCPGT